MPADVVIATGPSGWQGAGRILASTLRELGRLGCNVTYVGRRVPVAFQDAAELGRVSVVLAPRVEGAAIGPAAAIPDENVLLVYSLAQTIVNHVERDPRNRTGRIVVWGVFLYPYVAAAAVARKILEKRGFSVSLWVTPTGSDVWELSPQIRDVTMELLSAAGISKMIVYSERFGDEIARVLGYGGSMEVLCPAVDENHFRPPTPDERIAAKEALGIATDEFVLSCHCNMRPVKMPQDVIYAAHEVAQRLSTRVVLLMTGPRLEDSGVPSETRLRVIWPGVLENVLPILWSADVELNLSRHDSFNLSLAEAMSVGVPACTTDVVGIGPHVAQSGSGYLVPLEASRTWADGRYQSAVQWIVGIARDSAVRERLRYLANAYAGVHFSLARLRRDLLGLLA